MRINKLTDDLNTAKRKFSTFDSMKAQRNELSNMLGLIEKELAEMNSLLKEIKDELKNGRKVIPNDRKN